MPAYKSNRGTWYTSFYYVGADGERRRKKKEGFKTKHDALEWERTYILEHSGFCCLCSRCPLRESCRREASA